MCVSVWYEVAPVLHCRASVPIPADRIDNPLLHLERIKEVKKYMHIITGKS